MTIVIGAGIDKNPDDDNYQLTFEAVDLAKPIKTMGLTSMIIEAEGKTLFDAARNAKKKVTNKLYFGQTQVFVVSEELARSEDLNDIIDWFMRNREIRETILPVISQEKTAREIIEAKGLAQGIASNEILQILELDNNVTSSTLSVECYEAFNILKAKGKSLVLPAVHNVINNGEPTVEANGVAVYKDSKLIGYLTPEETKYYLFAVNKIKGGLFTFSSTGDSRDDTTLEISKNTTKTSFENIDGKVKIQIHTDTTVKLNEFMGYNNALDDKEIAALEDSAGKKLGDNIS